jgi:hypothetical protein
MLLECGRCGAPLNAKRSATRTKCRYCGAVDERQRLRVTSEETPKDYKPPKVWTPPPTAAIESKPLAYKPEKEPGFFVVMGVSVVFLAAAIGLPLLWDSSIWNTTPATITRASPIGPRKVVAKRLKGNVPIPSEITVALKSERYAKLSIRYPDATSEVPNSISLELQHGVKADAEALSILSKRLNGGLDEHGLWAWGGAHITGNEHGLFAELQEPTDPALRSRRVLALWALLMGAAFDPSVQPTPEEMQLVLGGGYPITELAKVSPTTPVNEAKHAVLTAFPGAIVEDARQMRLRIPLDHPLVSSVELRWFIMAGGTLDDITFAGKPALAAARPSFAQCLSRTLGQPRETLEDPVEGTKGYTFFPGNGWLDVYAKALSLHAYGPNNIPTTIDSGAWQKIIAALDTCRG